MTSYENENRWPDDPRDDAPLSAAARCFRDQKYMEAYFEGFHRGAEMMMGMTVKYIRKPFDEHAPSNE